LSSSDSLNERQIHDNILLYMACLFNLLWIWNWLGFHQLDREGDASWVMKLHIFLDISSAAILRQKIRGLCTFIDKAWKLPRR
jgi:hypothetical protein